MMKMTGINKFGLYETKEDRKYNLIEALKEQYENLDRYTDEMNMRMIRVATIKITDLEMKLTDEFGMNEEQIYLATH